MEFKASLPSLPSLLNSINVKPELKNFHGAVGPAKAFSPRAATSTGFEAKPAAIPAKAMQGFQMGAQAHASSSPMGLQGIARPGTIQELVSGGSRKPATESKATQNKGKPALSVDVKSPSGSASKASSSMMNHWYGTRQQQGSGSSSRSSQQTTTSASAARAASPETSSARKAAEPSPTSPTLSSEACNEDGTSPVYTGVSRSGLNGRWRAQLSTRGKTVHLGTFASAEEAARAWDRAAIGERGSAAITNFNIKDYLQEDGTLKPELTKPAGRKGEEGGASGHKEYRGVYHSGTYGRWKARIVMNGQKIHLGTFSTAEEAARAWDRKAIEYRGFGTVTNFEASDYAGMTNVNTGSKILEGDAEDSDAASGATTARSDHRSSDSEGEDSPSMRPWSPPLEKIKETGKRKISEIAFASADDDSMKMPKLPAIELNTCAALGQPEPDNLLAGASLLALCAAAGV